MLITTKRFCDLVKISLHKITHYFISVISQYPSLTTLTVFIASFLLAFQSETVIESKFISLLRAINQLISSLFSCCWFLFITAATRIDDTRFVSSPRRQRDCTTYSQRKQQGLIVVKATVWIECSAYSLKKQLNTRTRGTFRQVPTREFVYLLWNVPIQIFAICYITLDVYNGFRCRKGWHSTLDKKLWYMLGFHFY